MLTQKSRFCTAYQIFSLPNLSYLSPFGRSGISDKGDHEKEQLIMDWRGSLIKDQTKRNPNHIKVLGDLQPPSIFTFCDWGITYKWLGWCLVNSILSIITGIINDCDQLFLPLHWQIKGAPPRIERQAKLDLELPQTSNLDREWRPKWKRIELQQLKMWRRMTFLPRTIRNWSRG